MDDNWYDDLRNSPILEIPDFTWVGGNLLRIKGTSYYLCWDGWFEGFAPHINTFYKTGGQYTFFQKIKDRSVSYIFENVSEEIQKELIYLMDVE